MKPSMLEQMLERECADIDRIIVALGMTIEQGRTEGGSLRVSDILERIKAHDMKTAEHTSVVIRLLEENAKLKARLAEVEDLWNEERANLSRMLLNVLHTLGKFRSN